jgi:hypothetical protein
MKLSLLFGFFILLFAGFSADAQKKHALIFAIGDYPQEGGWGTISSAQDIGYIKKALTGKGFPEANIKTIAEAQATKAGIEGALKALIATVDTSDVVVIHFSSHGEQVADNNGDEADGYDEAIVSYNAALISQEINTAAASRGSLTKAQFDKLQANYFRDDEFGAYIQQLRAKLGKNGDVVVFMDNCHSGTGTRGSAKVRGGKGALTYEGYVPNIKKAEGDDVFKDVPSTRGNESNLATYVVISAALASELNYETVGDDQVGMGSLTYAISKVLASLKPDATYRSLFAKIQAVMSEKVPGQHPVLEGNGLDRGVFNGKFESQKPYIEIEKISNPLELVVKGGTFAGLNIGAKVNIYPVETKDPSKAVALAKGVVVKTNSYQATVKLDKTTKAIKPSLIIAFMAEPVFNVKPVVVGFASKSRGIGYTQAETDKITAALKRIKLVNLVGAPELLIEKGANGDTIRVESNGYVFSALKNAADTAELGPIVSKYAQYQFLQKVVLVDPNINAQVKFIPVLNGKPDPKIVAAPFTERPYEFTEGDSVVLWVKNTSKKDIFINVLDMQPDGTINSVFPNTMTEANKIYPSDLIIKTGATRVFSDYVIVMSPPYGMELFKIFVSAKQINLEGLATAKAIHRGNLGVLEGLVKTSSTISTRGAGVVAPKETDGTVYNLFFRIKER